MRPKNSVRTVNINIITGLAGQGKTLLAKILLLNYDMPVIIIDRQMQFENGVIFHDVKSLYNTIVNNEERFYNLKPILILQSDNEDEELLFNKIYNALQNPRRTYPRDILLVLDETDDYFKNGQPSYLEKIVKFARNRGINLIATLKRPQGIHKTLETQATATFYFRSNNALDLDKCRKTYGIEISEKLKTLDRLEFLMVENRADAEGNYKYTVEKIPESDEIFEVI